ncbi:MAG: type II secretion system F family protein [Anaerolineaceae bacterium]|jgi:tight adherence protein C
MLIPVLIIFAILLAGAVFLVYIGLRNPGDSDDTALLERLEEFNRMGEEVSLEKIELSQPFSERVIYPVARALGQLAVRFTPQNALHTLEKKLELAGNPGNLEPSIFLTMQFFAMIFLGGLIFLTFQFSDTGFSGGRIFLISVVFALLGFFLPRLWLSSKISNRQKDIRRSMPDALDLLTICVEAGLGFDAAMAKVCEKWNTELSLAFARVIQEVQLGKVRRVAMKDMADRIGLTEMTSFVAAVIQSEQLGVSLAKVLRIQADQMRTRRRQLAEEEAHKAPIKMLIPMGLLIFPSLMIVLLTPAALRLMKSALAGMF